MRARSGVLLFADDDEDYRFFVDRALQGTAFYEDVRIFDGGSTVIKYLQGSWIYADRDTHPVPDMLFLDAKMPPPNGFDVLRWMQTHPQHRVIPTIILSASSHPADVDTAYELGAQAYLVKPDHYIGLLPLVEAANRFWTTTAKPIASNSRSEDQLD